MGYLSATLTQVSTGARAEQTCHSEMSQELRWETGLERANDVTHWKRAENLRNFEERVES